MTAHDNTRQLHKRGRLLISSRSNPKVKALRELRQRRERERERERERSELFFVDGLHLVAAADELGAMIESLVIAPDLLTSRFGQCLHNELRQRGIPCLEVTAEVFESLGANEKTQGIAAVVRQRWHPLPRGRPGEQGYWVALEAVSYPGNLGTILRTCDAVGCAGVILLGASTDPYDPAAVRASLGAIFSQQLIRASLIEFAEWTKEHGYTVVGTSPAASAEYQALRYQPPLVLLLGSEAHGLSAQGFAICDRIVRIPMIGHNDSLNLSVAASVVLYEIFNQQCRLQE
jgi:TrmH family RNA methyltransferase